MDTIVKKPPYKIMHVVFNQFLRLNFNKVLFSVILFSIVNMLLCAVPFSFVLPVVTNGDALTLQQMFSYIALAFITLAVVIFIFFALIYGLFCISTRLIQKEKVTAGWLFIAFRKKDKRIIPFCIFSGLFYFVVCALAGFLISFYFANKDLGSLTDAEKLFYSFLPFLAALACVFVFLPFVFVPLILYCNPEIKFWESVRQSAKILFGQAFHFAGFVLYAAGTPLLAVVLLTIVLFVIPPSVSAVFKVPVMLLSFARICEFFKCIARAIIGICVYFFFATGRMRLYIISEEKPEGEIESPS